MKTYGIIAEYNPFHNGHKYQIDKTREKGATHIVAVMSGNYVQRGDVAIVDKFSRARECLNNGVDLVLELPVIYSLSTAEKFAEGAISILKNTSCVDGISFGSECGDVSLLKMAAKASIEISQSKKIMEKLEAGTSYPRAMQEVIEETYEKEISDVFRTPNNLLGIEYIKALIKYDWDIDIMTIERKNTMHDSKDYKNGFASASMIRESIKNGEKIIKAVPESTEKMLESCFQSGKIHTVDNLQVAMLYKLRCMTAEDFSILPDVSNGLENRIYKAVQSSVTVDEILFKIKTKRYPLSRIRRILLCALIGIKREDYLAECPYARVLAMNDRGCKLMRMMKKHEFNVNTSVIKLSERSVEAERLLRLEMIATDIYNLSCKNKDKCKKDYTVKITKQ